MAYKLNDWRFGFQAIQIWTMNLVQFKICRQNRIPIKRQCQNPIVFNIFSIKNVKIWLIFFIERLKMVKINWNFDFFNFSNEIVQFGFSIEIRDNHEPQVDSIA